MDFSILLASRSRVPLLTNFLTSIKIKTHDLNNVEVLIGIDDDDKMTCNAARRLQGKFKFAYFHQRKRSPNINGDYLNWLFGFSSGRFVISCNDDSLFSIDGWDRIVINRLEAYLADKPDGIAYAWLNDNLTERYGMDFCCFPLVTRAGVHALGFVLTDFYWSWNADIHCWRVYNSVGRVCKIPEVTIDHISHHCGKRPRDSINENMKAISLSQAAPGGAVYDISKDVMKLSSALASRTKLTSGEDGVLFSIIIPTIERPELLATAIDSIHNSSIHEEQVQIVVVYNAVDKKTEDAIPALSSTYGKLVSFHPVDSSNMLIRDYINHAYQFCKGNFIIVGHDDCRFTRNWDIIVASKLEQYLYQKPDGILYGKMNDDIDGHQETFTSFPLLSRKSIDALGYIMSPDFQYRGADLHLWRVFYCLDRVIDLTLVRIEHHSYHNGKRERDAVNDYTDQFMSTIPYNPLDCDITSELDKLRVCMI